MDQVDRYEVIVIGGGPGGYVAAIHAANAGRKTALVEKDALGGTCLNWGCIPTKALLRNAEVLETLNACADYGIQAKVDTADYAKAQTRSREVSAKLVKGIDSLLKKRRVSVIKEEAILLPERRIRLTGSGKTIQGDSVILATGSRPFYLPMLDYSNERILDSKKALQLKHVPRSLVIVGAGAIGVEMAAIFHAYGSKIHLVEMQSRILPSEDDQISDLATKELARRGYAIHTDTKLVQVQADKNGLSCVLEKNGRQFQIESDYLLAATGIAPNSEHLDAAGVACDSKGYVKINECMQTNLPGVYAIGDLTGALPLAHVASAQAQIAVRAITGEQFQEIQYTNMPRCVYTVPEIASAGLTAAAAIALGYTVQTAVFPLAANGKALSYGDPTGFVKIVSDKKYGQLLGVHMIGHGVTEIIGSITGYLGLEVTIDELALMVYPHPTISECLIEAAHLTQGHAVHI